MAKTLKTMTKAQWEVFDSLPSSVRALCNEYSGVTQVAIDFRRMPEDKLLKLLNDMIETSGRKKGPVAKRKSSRVQK